MLTRGQFLQASSLLLGCVILGCSQATGPATADRGTAGASTNSAGPGAAAELPPSPGAALPVLPTASIPARQIPADELEDAEPEDTQAVELAAPEQGSPEWLIREIVTLRVEPLPQPQPDDTPEAVAAAIEKQKEVRRDRNLKTVELAREALSKTSAPEAERVFNVAAHHFLEAHFQLALSGETSSIEALLDAAEVFYKRNPESDAAAEASLTVVNMAHAFARTDSPEISRWLVEFANQAKLYASRFPKDQARALPLLWTAARSCEFNGLMEPAKSAYAVVNAKFPESPQGQQAAAIVRRLELPGHPVQLAGPTRTGEFFSLADCQGQAVIVVFWSTAEKAVLDLVPTLNMIHGKYGKYVRVVGVNLDAEDLDLEVFLSDQNIGWPQIFYNNPEERRWNSPAAAYYGIQAIPAIWLIDPNGIAVSTNVKITELEAQMVDTVKKYRKQTAEKSGASTSR